MVKKYRSNPEIFGGVFLEFLRPTAGGITLSPRKKERNSPICPVLVWGVRVKNHVFGGPICSVFPEIRQNRAIFEFPDGFIEFFFGDFVKDWHLSLRDYLLYNELWKIQEKKSMFLFYKVEE